MDQEGIRKFLELHADNRARTIVIVDFSNVEKWKDTLGWKIGIQELAQLVKSLSHGNQLLRRFYYGSDYGPKERSATMTDWSEKMMARADRNRFQVVTKRVKYMPNVARPGGYDKKCDLDVEMAVDLIAMRDLYDHIVVFSGDGDLSYALRYLQKEFSKRVCVFGARNNIGREIIDAEKEGVVSKILFAEDFEYRLNLERFRG